MTSKGALIYEGKAKKLFEISGDSSKLWVEYKNSLTAFNAQKKGEFERKGEINLKISTIIFKLLKADGIKTHWIENRSENEMIVERVKIIPLEVVVRNVLAGSTAKKMGLAEGTKITRPLVEFYFKNDDLADPFVSDDQIEVLGIADKEQIQSLKLLALKVNATLLKIFSKINLSLIDFKVEFGFDQKGNIILADEISPDCMRLWDIKTGEKMDKDRFRRDLGNVKESYQEVLRRLEEVILEN